MAEATGQFRPSPEVTGSREPVGLRVLGIVDPSTLTREQFFMSPDLLYHGSKFPKRFKRDFQYGVEETSEGSSTLGRGFYTTPHSQDAYDYSKIRSFDPDHSHVIEIMPYQAQMLDLRLKNDPEKNGDIPRELAAEWIEMYRANLPGMLERSQDKPFRMRRVLENTYQEYLRLLEGIMKSEHFTLRELLGTEFNSNIPHSMERGNPFWASLFSTFMVKQGYDGVIQIEQSERQKDKYPPTYVFYNLEKIGDYDTWHAEEAANP